MACTSEARGECRRRIAERDRRDEEDGSVWSIWLVSCNETNRTDHMNKTGWQTFSAFFLDRAGVDHRGKSILPHWSVVTGVIAGE